MKTIFRILNFRILSMRARVRAIITGKLLWHGFFGNKILEGQRDFKNIYLQKFPTIRYHSTIKFSNYLIVGLTSTMYV